jgi:hypothetical protein
MVRYSGVGFIGLLEVRIDIRKHLVYAGGSRDEFPRLAKVIGSILVFWLSAVFSLPLRATRVALDDVKVIRYLPSSIGITKALIRHEGLLKQ